MRERALARHRQLLNSLESQRKKWDVVVLQSYRHDLDGDRSLYVEYAPKFAELIEAQGGSIRVETAAGGGCCFVFVLPAAEARS